MQPVQFVSPVGRLVAGSLTDPETTDMQGDPLVVKSGANKGAARVDFFFMLAIEKRSPELAQFQQLLMSAAQQAWGPQIPPNFSWKVIDGDGVDSKNIPYSQREGYAGCYVVKFSSGFAPRCYSNGMPIDPKEIPLGMYVRVAGTIAGNGNSQKPGMYINHSMVERVAFGPEIFKGPDPREVFKAQPAYMPAGASATPVAPVGGGAPGYNPGQMPGGYNPGAPAYNPGGMPGQMPGGMPGQMPGGYNPGAPAYNPGGMPGQMPGAPAYNPGGMPGQMPGGYNPGAPAYDPNAANVPGAFNPNAPYPGPSGVPGAGPGYNPANAGASPAATYPGNTGWMGNR